MSDGITDARRQQNMSWIQQRMLFKRAKALNAKKIEGLVCSHCCSETIYRAEQNGVIKIMCLGCMEPYLVIRGRLDGDSNSS